MGAGHARIMLRHVLPNVFAPVMVSATVGLGGVILAEASLSFLGLGINDPGQPTWGQMLAQARRFLNTELNYAVWPCSPSTCWATPCATCSTRACAPAVERPLREAAAAP